MVFLLIISDLRNVWEIKTFNGKEHEISPDRIRAIKFFSAKETERSQEQKRKDPFSAEDEEQRYFSHGPTNFLVTLEDGREFVFSGLLDKTGELMESIKRCFPDKVELGYTVRLRKLSIAKQ
jgi:hypothetical protein